LQQQQNTIQYNTTQYNDTTTVRTVVERAASLRDFTLAPAKHLGGMPKYLQSLPPILVVSID